MSVRFAISISLDGFLAGPNPSVEQPLGEGGEELHQWVIALEAWRRPHGLEGGEVNESTRVVDAAQANVGSYLMGREMFGGGPGPWGDEPWQGWWGDEPPFHAPVFVLTHHAREPLELGDTTFHFVDGFEAGLAQAREAAGEKDVVIAGGASAVQQAFAVGAVDEFTLSVAPILLGSGTRLLDDLPASTVELVEVIEAPGVTHLRYRVGK